MENEKYAFQCFLLRLGSIGDECREERKALLSRLTTLKHDSVQTFINSMLDRHFREIRCELAGHYHKLPSVREATRLD